MEVKTDSRVSCTHDFYNTAVAPVTKLEPVTEITLASDDAKVKHVEPSKRDDDATPGKSAPCNAQPVHPEEGQRPSVSTVDTKSNVGKYRLLRTIGKGNFAKVKLAIHMATGVEVAIKIINKTVMDSTLLKRLKREITIMKLTNHPNIVRLLEIIENEDVLCLVMEYASGGEIFDYLVANGKMREKEARVKFRQLLSAVQYCHSKRIVHRDLKAENILLDKNLNVKVADFGLANHFDYDQRLTTFCGSPPYAAPELFLGIPYYGPGVDVWSLGVILFTLVLGHLPFDARDIRELRSKILGLHYTIPKGTISPECEALLRKMLVLDPKDRSSLKVLMQDKWINIGYAPGEQLRPYKEPPKSQLDEVRVKAMEAMGFTRTDLEASVVNPEFDHVYATYHLLPETPSQFMALCEELAAGGRKSQITDSWRVSAISAVSQTAAVQPPPTTAVGRFTVAPSENTADLGVQSSVASHSSAVPPADSSAPIKQPPYPMADTGTREHHSLTSALPVALRKAIVQMGRTLVGGGTYSGSTTHSGSAVGSDAHQRSVTSAGGRVPARPPSKQSDGRSAVTTAPVPMGSTKKTASAIGPSNKRSPPTGRSGSTDSSSTQPVHSSRSPAYPGPNATPQPSPSSIVDRVPKRLSAASSQQSSVNKRDSPPSHGKTAQGGPKISPRNVSTELRVSETSKGKAGESSRGSVRSTGLSVAVPTTKLSVTFSSSSDSYGNREMQKAASIIVQEAWRSAVRQSMAGQTQPVLGTSEGASTLGDDDQKSEQRGSKVFGSSNDPESATKEPSQRLATDALSTDSGGPSVARNHTELPKASHTVQGNEASVLRDEALRFRTDNSVPPPATPPRDPSNMTLDHQNTWSKGVIKAIGGLFTPGKPADQSPFTPVTDVELLAKPREVRFPWSVHTTSTKSAEQVLQCIIEALEVTPGCRYAYDAHLPYLVRCSWAADRPALRPDASLPQDESKPPIPPMIPSGLHEDPVHWEMEVCQLPRLHLRGVRLKRIRGCALHFRPIAGLVMKSLHL